MTNVVVPAVETATHAETIDALSRPPRLGRLWATYAADAVVVIATVLVLDRFTPSPEPVLALIPVWLLILVALRAGEAGPGGVEAGRMLTRVLRAAALLGLGAWTAVVVTGLERASDSVLLTVAACAAGSLAVRFAGLAVLRRSRTERRTRLMLVGDPYGVERVLGQLDKRSPFEVVSVCLDKEQPFGSALPVPCSVGLHTAALQARVCGADAVLVLPPVGGDPAELRRLTWQLEQTGTDLFVGTGLLDVHPDRATAASLSGLAVVHLRSARRTGLVRRLWNLACRTAAIVVLVLLLPLLAAIALGIRLETPGPAIFRQLRIGRDGKPFTMYKFRSMAQVPLAPEDLAALNEADGVLFKCRQDPRITRLGRLLRRYSLDELPQLVNIALGQMTVVGPRPALPCEVEQYADDVRRRLVVEPGLTGLWQVSGRSDLSWEETVRLDLSYVDNWSLRSDLLILGRTFGAVLGHRGAY